MPKPENAAPVEEEFTDTIFPLEISTDADEAEDADESTAVEDADAATVFDEISAPLGPTLNATSETTPVTEDATSREVTLEQLITIPPSPDHESFLSSLPPGEFGFSLGVYADRVEEDGLHDAAQVLRHDEAYLAFPKHVGRLHRAICTQIERIFGGRHIGRLDDESPALVTDSDHPNRLYIRMSSLLCFEDQPPLSGNRHGEAELVRILSIFEQRITKLHPRKNRHLIIRKRPWRYEVVLLPLLFAYLSGLPSEITGVRPASGEFFDR